MRPLNIKPIEIKPVNNAPVDPKYNINDRHKKTTPGEVS
jgi:hypothetical protein